MKDGTTHLAYKPEHASGSLDTGAVVAAELHPADSGRHEATLFDPKRLETAKRTLRALTRRRRQRTRPNVVTDKGYHSRAVLKALDNGPWKTSTIATKQ